MKPIYLFSLILINFGTNYCRNDRPLIALLSQDSFSKPGQSYIAASYVKYLESAGARVVPVLTHQNQEYYESIVNETDGLLFPGGGQDLHTSGYAKAAKMMWDYVFSTKLNRSYPIWGTCLGFELLITLIDPQIKLDSCDSSDVANELIFTSEKDKSRLFKGADPSLINILKSENVTYNHHNKCLLYSKRNENFNKYFNVLSTTIDKNGSEYISTIESKEGEVYGVQWHPEKNPFEFGFNKILTQIPHSSNAILISQYMNKFFVDRTRASTRPLLRVDKEHKLLIYNYEPQYTGTKENYEFEQVYFFNTSRPNLWCVSFINYLLMILMIALNF